MSELIAYSMGIRGARVDPHLCDHQSKKAFPHARASQLSGAKVADQENAVGSGNAAAGRKSLAKEFENKVHSQQQPPSQRKVNPDAMKQTTNERVLLGKKTSASNLASSATWEGASVVASSSNSNTTSATNSRRNSFSSNFMADHFQSSNVALPEQGASPKKGGLRFMSGPPEFVAEAPKPSIRHTHTVKNARGSTSSIGGLISNSAAPQQQQINKSDYKRGASSATYNIITGQ